MLEQNPSGDAPKKDEQNPQQTVANLPANPPAQSKVEVKDGVVLVDGKKYVKESELIASKESLAKQLETAQSVHNEAVDKLKLEVSQAQQSVAQANAALEEAKKARSAGDISADEMSKIKKEAEDAKTGLTAANASALNYRRQYILTAYGISPTSDIGKNLMEKSMAQLDSFEEALKALNTSRGGPGNYAFGGGGGGTSPISDMDKAKALIAATPYRGVRNATTADKTTK